MVGGLLLGAKDPEPPSFADFADFLFFADPRMMVFTRENDPSWLLWGLLQGLGCRGYAAGAMLQGLCCSGYAARAMPQGLCCRSYAAGVMLHSYATGAMLHGLCCRDNAAGAPLR